MRRLMFATLLVALAFAAATACRTTAKQPEPIEVQPIPSPVEQPAEADAPAEEATAEEAFAEPPPPPPTRPMVRGFWADTWGAGMLTPEQIDEMVQTARDANLNAIYAEVRKVGDAHYRLGFEPFASNDRGPEGWDPLQYLIDKCHDTSGGKRYIEVHAWLVTFRLWRANLGEPPAGHLFAQHPDTVMLTGEGEASASGTMFADPGHPIVQDWTARVFRNLAEKYDIDGIHHDYVRYPEYEGDWGHNPVSLARFRARTGIEGKPAPDDPAWRAWRREQVANVVRRVYAEVMEVNPSCIVSASTLNWGLDVPPERWFVSNPRLGAHQDWVRFMIEGTLDENVLMNYARYETQKQRFSQYTDLVLRTRIDRHGIIGVGTYLNTVDDGFAQIREAIDRGADGILVYSYRGTNSERVPRAEFFRRLREEIFPEPVAPPARAWKENPVYGAVIGQCFDADGNWIDDATVTLDGVQALRTDGTGFFGWMRVLPGRHIVELTKPDGSRVRGEVTVEAGRAARHNFDLRM